MRSVPRRHKQKGVISIEWAILFPVLLLSVLLVFDVLRIHLQFNALEHGLRSTLRASQIELHQGRKPQAQHIQQKIEQHSNGLLKQVKVSIRHFSSLDELLGRPRCQQDCPVTTPVALISARYQTYFALLPASWGGEALQAESHLILLSQRRFVTDE